MNFEGIGDTEDEALNGKKGFGSRGKSKEISVLRPTNPNTPCEEMDWHQTSKPVCKTEVKTNERIGKAAGNVQAAATRKFWRGSNAKAPNIFNREPR